MELMDLIKDTEKCDDLLARLNDIAKSFNCYELGLPIWDEGAKALMREAIYKWAATDN